jgi:hypothetical protein
MKTRHAGTATPGGGAGDAPTAQGCQDLVGVRASTRDKRPPERYAEFEDIDAANLNPADLDDLDDAVGTAVASFGSAGGGAEEALAEAVEAASQAHIGGPALDILSEEARNAAPSGPPVDKSKWEESQAKAQLLIITRAVSSGSSNRVNCYNSDFRKYQVRWSGIGNALELQLTGPRILAEMEQRKRFHLPGGPLGEYCCSLSHRREELG